MSDKLIVQKIILGAVVIHDGKTLIMQRNDNEDIFPGIWELPSGKREPLEPSEESLLREVKEETGLDVFIISVISVFDYQIKKESEIRDSTQINFLVKVEGSVEVQLSDEHQAFKWITKGELNDYNLTESAKKVISKAFGLIPKIT